MLKIKEGKYLVIFVFIILVFVFLFSNKSENRKNEDKSYTTRGGKTHYEQHVEDNQKTKNMTHQQKLEYYQKRLDESGYTPGRRK